MSELTDYPAMPPVQGHAEHAIDRQASIQNAEVSRRSVLALGGVLAAEAVVGMAVSPGSPVNVAANEIQNTRWPKVHLTRIQNTVGHEANDSPKASRKLWTPKFVSVVGVPGYGGRDGQIMVNKLKDQQIFAPDCQYYYVTYPVGGFDKYDLLRGGDAWSKNNNVSTVNFENKSMGGISGMYIAMGANKRISSIVLDCSPRSINDARDAVAAKLAVEISSILRFDGDIRATYLTNAFNGFRDADPLAAYDMITGRGVEEVLSVLMEAGISTLNGEEPRTQMSGLKLMVDAESDLENREKQLGKLLSTETAVYFAFPQDPDSDETVWVVSAFQGWQEYFANFGIRVTPVRYRERGHAVTDASIRSVAPLLRERFVEIDPYESRQMHHGVLSPRLNEELKTDTVKPAEKIREELTQGYTSHQKYDV